MNVGPTVSDEKLVEQAREAPEGDFRAFEQLLERHKEKILANCRFLTRSPDDAEDLAQEVFVKAFYGLGRFEGRSSFRTWIQRIKINHSLNHLRKQEGKTFVDVTDAKMESRDELAVQPVAERRAVAMSDRERIAHVLDSMSDTLRIPLIMCDMDHVPYKEIADVLGIGLSATKMRIKRAREEFRRRFRELSGEASDVGTGPE